MAEQLEADLAVIGAGPAGQKGAIQGAKAGKKVVVIDRLGLLGGACLNQGTVPSKTLRATILDMTGFIQSAYHGKRLGGSRQISVEDLRSFMEKVIAEENQVLAQECAANGIVTAFGPRFTDPHTLEVVDAEQRVTYVVRAHKHLIATGSSPRHPLALPPDSEDIFVDSDIIFKMEKIPESLIVLGGGIIGCEYATMFAALGVKVTLVDRRDDLLRMLDGEIQKAFAEYISHIPDLSVRMGLAIDELKLTGEGTGAEIVLKDGKGAPSLASTSVEQGRLAVRNMFHLRSHHFPEFFPYGIYTIPEVSSVGPTEEELQKRGVRYEVGRARYSEIARGPIAGDTQGPIKLLFHAETRELLGVHIIGTHATELISRGQMALSFRVQLDYFVDTIFNYPTFAEGFRIAALNGLNKLPDYDA